MAKRWLNVNKKEPERNVEVLLLTQTGYEIAHMPCSETRWRTRDGKEDLLSVFWQHLPEKPKRWVEGKPVAHYK